METRHSPYAVQPVYMSAAVIRVKQGQVGAVGDTLVCDYVNSTQALIWRRRLHS